MSEKRTMISTGGTCSIFRERLNGSSTYLTDLVFRQGANVYVFSYEKEGVIKHTFIDAGDSLHQNEILTILDKSDIDSANIERIIITHRHPDHCGLAYLLASKANAKIMVHSNFRDFIENTASPEETRWMGDSNTSRLRECDIEYLPQSSIEKSININGVDFPCLVEPIEIGEKGKLEILASPQSASTHSPDQIVVLYSQIDWPYDYQERRGDYRPADDILFSGDLWLMRGPMFNPGMSNITQQFRYGVQQVKNLVAGRGMARRDPREQDATAKEALKKGFCLITVKPGHGEEFLGSRMIPNSLMGPRDLLMEFGYPMDADISILKSAELAPRVADRLENAYASFVQELLLWAELGYSIPEMTELLARIYREQSGGGMLVENDRGERRKRLKMQLDRIKADETATDELHQLAESTLSALKNVS